MVVAGAVAQPIARFVSSKRDLVEQLLDFPDSHPYARWTGTHWRLVEIADAALPVPKARLDRGVSAELAWLLPGLKPRRVPRLKGRARRHASMEGNALYALCRLGYVGDPGTRQLADALLDWQWPDGGWNCDRHPDASRSSFHESAIPALGLASYAHLTGYADARAAAGRTAELLLEHRLFRSTSTGEPIHPSWVVLHYPAYWHYDILQGFRLLLALDRVDDVRAADALEVLERARRPDGRFSGRRWSSSRQPAAVNWGVGPENLLLNELATAVLAATSAEAGSRGAAARPPCASVARRYRSQRQHGGHDFGSRVAARGAFVLPWLHDSRRSGPASRCSRRRRPGRACRSTSRAVPAVSAAVLAARRRRSAAATTVLQLRAGR